MARLLYQIPLAVKPPAQAQSSAIHLLALAACALISSLLAVEQLVHAQSSAAKGLGATAHDPARIEQRACCAQAGSPNSSCTVEDSKRGRTCLGQSCVLDLARCHPPRAPVAGAAAGTSPAHQGLNAAKQSVCWHADKGMGGCSADHAVPANCSAMPSNCSKTAPWARSDRRSRDPALRAQRCPSLRAPSTQDATCALCRSSIQLKIDTPPLRLVDSVHQDLPWARGSHRPQGPALHAGRCPSPRASSAGTLA